MTFRPFNRARTTAALLCTGLAGAAWAGPTTVPLQATITTQESLRPDGAACPAPPFADGARTTPVVCSPRARRYAPSSVCSRR